MANWFNRILFGAESQPILPEAVADQRSVVIASIESENFLKKLGLENLKVYVNADNSMGIATFYSCVNFISKQCAALPYNVYRSEEGSTPRRERKHPLDSVLETRFNKNMGSFVARRSLYLNYLVHGFAIAEIQRNRSRQTVGIIPYPSNQVQIKHNEKTDDYFFEIPHLNKTLSQDDVIFLKDLNFNGAIGYSVTDWQHKTIKLDLLSKEYAVKHFENGAYMAGIITHPAANNAKDEDAAKVIKKRALDSFNGTDGGAGIAVMPDGVKYTPIGLDPHQSQLLEIFSMSKKDIALLFGVPLSILGDTEVQSSWGSGVEQMNINLVNYVFNPIATQTEQEVDYKCFRADERADGYYTRHNFKGLLKGDLKAQTEHLTKMVSNGIYTPDEARYYDEKAPLPDGVGARAYMNGTMNPLDLIDEIKGQKAEKNGKRKAGNPSES